MSVTSIFMCCNVLYAYKFWLPPPVTLNLNLPGVGWICLGLSDKDSLSSVHLLPRHRGFTVLQPCSPASSDTGCIIYVEKTLAGWASIWPF